ncbi:hypothetical protein [Streptomyces hiroshimensis]|uniref:Uncharacterized protein n=1 Tax=Streptomyces hiroshimensis TaxID=66424 RepID=A0ABQ2YBD7_9ACTN|nr:hypothetical protein [Streptomyces hiroshimensis]GGX78908.1 hypothetical protein GCM10010324_25590 [Streptomyces hiroshimensis]
MKLPPPPPPWHLSTWPDRGAMLADRSRALDALIGKVLSPGRLLTAWLLTGVFMLGWTFAVLGLRSLAEGGVEYIYAAAYLILAAGAAVPALLGVRSGLRASAEAGRRLRLWAALDRDAVTDAGFRAAGRVWFWLLMSLLPCAGALAVGGAAVAEMLTATTVPKDGSALAYAWGLTAPPAAAGAYGVATALTHRRWFRSLNPR